MRDVPIKATLGFVSLGCAKNLVDSERMLGLVAQAGYAPVPDPDGADIVIVNTCGFIDEARQESMDVIGEMADLKRRDRAGALVVAGCLAERHKRRLLEDVPEIDAVVGVFAREDIVAVCDRLLRPRARRAAVFGSAGAAAWPETARLRLTPRHMAYLKVSEGCDRRCTFCSIPLMRGRSRSKPFEEVLREADELAADGVRELCVIAQDTTAYGIDLYGCANLAELLGALARMRRLRWIRLLYAYPHDFPDELLDVMADQPKIVPYLDLPLQHINDRVLRRMGRRVTRAQTEGLLSRLRKRIPGIAVRTTMLVGFPGETQAEFQELLDFVRQARFERLGCFAYSREPDTPAARMRGHLPVEEIEARRDELMRAQQRIAFAHNRRLVGKRVDLVVDGPHPEQRGMWLARTPAHAPDIDGWVFLTGKRLRAGRFVTGVVIRAEGYDLWARLDQS